MKSITIRNFQSHRNTVIGLDPGVNLLIGASDSGKSGIVRAIEWVRTGKPKGNSYASHWGGDTKVVIDFGQESVLRGRSGDKSCYKAANKDYFGTGVPEDVSGLLNIADVSVQDENADPYLLKCSPGEVARVLNKFAHLDSIDNVLGFLDTEAKQAARAVKVSNEALERLEADLSRYAGLDSLGAKIDLMSDKDKLVGKVAERHDVLSELLDDLEANTDALTGMDLGGLAHIQGVVDGLRARSSELSSMETKHRKLKGLLDALYNWDAEVEDERVELVKSEARLKKLTPDICPLCGGRWETK